MPTTLRPQPPSRERGRSGREVPVDCDNTPDTRSARAVSNGQSSASAESVAKKTLSVQGRECRLALNRGMAKHSVA